MFDLTTIIFLVIAVVILLKLWRVLGQRTGDERPPYDPYSPHSADNDDKVVTLPGLGKGSRVANENSASGSAPAMEAESETPDWGKFAPAGTPLADGLTAIFEKDRGFEPQGFLEGAGIAYEMIVTAFAEGNRTQLEALLSPVVYDGFSEVIAAREARGETVSSTFVGIDGANIMEAGIKDANARVTVKIRSKLISATLGENGDVTEGDLKKVREVTDIWTFERDMNSRDPNWRLAATEAAN